MMNSTATCSRSGRPISYLWESAVVDLSREGWAPLDSNLPSLHYMMSSRNQFSIPDRSRPGSTTTAPTVGHQDGGDKYATGASEKIRGRNNITIGTWNVRTLNADGKLEELTHEMSRYRWHIIGLSEMRWKNFGETTTKEGHKVYFSGKPNLHQHGVGFLVHKDIVNTVIGCHPISERLITIRLKATPFNISIIQAYAPTTTHSDEEVEDFYEQLQETLDEIPKKDIPMILGDWNAKVGKDAQTNWPNICGPSCNSETNDRGFRLLEFAASNDFKLANTMGSHKGSRMWTWHSPNGQIHNQIDYIMVKRRFMSGVHIAKTRSFPGADIGSDHELVMMTFQLRLKKIKKPSYTRLRFDLEKLKDPKVSEDFQAMIGGKFAPLTTLGDKDVEEMTTTFNRIFTETSTQILGKHRQSKKPWVTSDILDLCDQRRNLKREKYTAEGAKQYRIMNNKVKACMRKAKENWIQSQCNEIEDNLSRNNSKKAYQLVKDLTTEKQGKTTTIQDKSGRCLTENDKIHERWTEYCKELYNHEIKGDPNVLNSPEETTEDNYPILREEVEAAIKSLKKGKSAGVDNIPAELIQGGGETAITILTQICNKIWETGEWPTSWTKSLVITLPKKGNLQQCQNYRTISLISHPSKVMLKIILNRLKTQAEQIIAEEQAGFRAGRSTTEQIFNLRILCEKYNQHQQDLYHVFIDFKKAFDRVWHAALWATMRKYNISANLIRVIEHLYNKATSAVLFNGTTGEWFRTSVGVRQGCLLSPILFNIFLERIMTDALEHHTGTVSIGGRTITNLRFADDIDGLAGNEQELENLVKALDGTATSYGMEISAEKTKLMTNNNKGICREIKANGKKLETVETFKYLGSTITDEGSKQELLVRSAQTSAALTKLKPVWSDGNISLKSKVRLMRSLVLSIFLYACETWTLTADLQRRIQAMEMRCFRKILGISYKDQISNETVRATIRQATGSFEELLTIVKKRKLRWYGHVSRTSGLAKTILQGTVNGGRKRGKQKKRWADNIKEWTGLDFAKSQRAVEDRKGWRVIVANSSVVPQRPQRLRDR